MDGLQYYCQIMMIIFVLMMMTMIVMIMILHTMRSADENSDLVFN